MILCEACGQFYHLSCVGLKETPSGHWHCDKCPSVQERAPQAVRAVSPEAYPKADETCDLARGSAYQRGDGSNFHISHENDTPTTIAQRCGCSPRDIVAFNRLKYPALTAKSKFRDGTAVAVAGPIRRTT